VIKHHGLSTLGKYCQPPVTCLVLWWHRLIDKMYLMSSCFVYSPVVAVIASSFLTLVLILDKDHKQFACFYVVYQDFQEMLVIINCEIVGVLKI